MGRRAGDWMGLMLAWRESRQGACPELVLERLWLEVELQGLLARMAEGDLSTDLVDFLPVPDSLARHLSEESDAMYTPSGSHLPRRPEPASGFVDDLRETLHIIEGELQEQEQLRVSAVVGGREVVVDSIFSAKPALVTLGGFDPSTGERVVLLVHEEAVELVCTIEVLAGDDPPRRIGFGAKN